MRSSPFHRFLLWSLLVLLLSACDSTTAEEYLSKAQASYDAGEYRTAVIELKNALQQQPDLGAARLLLGRSQARLGDYPSALKEFERALDLGVANAQLRVDMLTAKNRLGRYQEVIGDLEQAGELTPELAAVLGDAYLAGQDLDGARNMFQQAASLSAGNLGLGTIAWMQGENDSARSYLNKATELAPDNYEAWLRLAEFEFSVADFAAAGAAFERAATNPGGALSGKLGLARVELAQNRPAAAAGYVSEVLQSAPQLFVAHYLDALIKFQQQDVDGAEAALREVQRTVPSHLPSLYLMGAVKYQQGQLSQARDNLQRFLAAQPANESAVKLLASVYLQDNEIDKAVALLETVAGDSADAQLLAMLGTAQLKLGLTATATTNLQAAVDLAPDAAAFRNQLALSLLSAGDAQRAETELQAAIEVDGEQFQSDYLIAMVRLREGDLAAARSAVDELIRKNPNSPLGYNLQGAVLLGLKDTSGGIAQFEKALTIDPAYFPAARSLARLDLSAGNISAAEMRFRSVLAAAPDHEGARLALAELALQTQDTEQAERELLATVQANPASLPARLGLIRLYLAQNRVADAQAQLASAPTELNNNPPLILLAADLDLRAGRTTAAREKADSLQLQLAAGADNVRLALALGSLQARAGQLTRARTNLEKVLAVDSSNITALLELARIDLQENHPAAVRGRLTTLAELSEQGDETALLEADLMRLEGKGELAMEAYRKLADAGVRDAVVRSALMSLAEGRTEEAAAQTSAWLAIHPDDVGIRLIQADTRLRSEDRSAAIAEYERLVSTDNPVVLNNLAWLYMERGDSRALAMAQRAAELAPQSADIADTLGWILVRGGKEKEAIAPLRRSVQINPDSATVHYHLAVAYQGSGDNSAAVAALQQALAVGNFPEQEQAQQLLQKLTGS